MTTVPETTAPVAFFTDERSLSEKLAVDERNWVPQKPEEECPAMVFGLVLERGTFVSSYKEGDKLLPTARILTAENVLWSVIGFHGYLRSELLRKDPRAGDFVALAFKGTKPSKKSGESDAYLYQIEVERNPDSAQPAAPAAAAEEKLEAILDADLDAELVEAADEAVSGGAPAEDDGIPF